MGREKTSPIIVFALAAIIAVSSLPIPCSAWNITPPIQAEANVSQFSKPHLRNLIYIEHKNIDTSMSNALDNLSVAIAANNTRRIVRAYNNIAWCYFCRNNFSMAAATYQTVLQICDSAHDRRNKAICLHNLANILAIMDRYNEANEYEHNAINIFYELNDEEYISKTGKTLGLMCINHHLYNTAAELLNHALEIDTRMNIRTNNNYEEIAYDYVYLGLIDFRKYFDMRNDSLLQQAKAKTLQAYEIFKTAKDNTSATYACRNLMYIYIECAHNAVGSQRQMFLDSSAFFHNIDLNLMKNAKNVAAQIDYLLWESKYAIETRQYGQAKQKLKAAKALIEIDPLKIFQVDYGHTMASYFEAVGDYQQSYEWSEWTTIIEKRQLNREFVVKSAKLSLKNELDDIIQQREIVREQEYIVRREQEIRLVVSTASTAFVLIMIAVLTFIVYKGLKRNKLLGKKLEKRNEDLESQKDQLECINNQIASSINFAHHMQTKMLPTAEQMNELLGDTLILWRPLDLVSGDFYWGMKSGRRKLVTIADCTGHGVPGGFMSMLGVSILSDITMTPAFKDGSMTAGQLLDLMRDNVVESLRQSEDGAMALDGMDMAVCIIDEDSPVLQFAGAFRPILVVHDGKLTEYKGDRMPISYIAPDPRPFKTVKIDVAPGDSIYIYSDGITDQFGYNDGGEQAKFSGRRLKQILEENCNKPFSEQKSIIENAIDNWRAPASKKKCAQTDDIILLGFRIRM